MQNNLFATGVTLLVDDFEDVSDWSGLKRETVLVHSGQGAGRWENQLSSKSIRKNFSPSLDVSRMDLIQFWVYSGKANNASIELIFDSENAADTSGWDYYRYPIVVDWTGWRLFRIPLVDFLVARNPIGWKQINYIQFSADGWKHTPQADTLFILDDMNFSTRIITDIHYLTNYSDSDFSYNYTMQLTERSGTPHTFSVHSSTTADFNFHCRISSSTVSLPANGKSQLSVLITIPTSLIYPHNALSIQSVKIVLREGSIDVDEEILPAAIPFSRRMRAHPRSLLNAADLSRISIWSLTQPWAANALSGIIQSAQGWPQKFIQTFFLSKWGLPPEGGQWSMWYLCPGTATYLQYQGPNKHVCPTDGKIYSGWPYEQVIYSRMHNDLAEAARDLGLAYRLTGELRYAQSSAEILRAYADRYHSYPYHDTNNKASQSGGRVLSQTLDESIWLISIAWAYDLIADSSALTATDRTHIEEDLLRAATATVSRNPAGLSNWQSWHNAGLAAVGFALEDPLIVAQSLLDSQNGFLLQMKRSVSMDGFWYEGSWGYHFYALTAHRFLAEMSARADLDLYAHPSLRNMFTAPLSFAMPDGNLPMFNDSGSVSLPSKDSLYESAFRRYGEASFMTTLGHRIREREALFWGVETLPAGCQNSCQSLLFPDAGYGILRADCDRDPFYLALDYGPHGGGHGHYDKLGFILFARGMVMGIDPGTQSYAAPTHETWDKQTLAHNTVLIDTQRQAQAEGNLLRFIATPGLGMMAADAGSAYNSAQLRRTMLMTPEYVLDYFRVHTLDGKTHDIDWIYHNPGSLTTTLPLAPYSDFPAQNGYQHLDKVNAATTNDHYTVTFDTSVQPGTNFGSTYSSPATIAATFTLQKDYAFHGSGTGRMTYDFSSVEGYILYNVASLKSIGEIPKTFRLALYGDGSGQSLTLRVYDHRDERFSCSLGKIDWTGWKVVSTPEVTSCAHFLGDADGIFDVPLKQVSIQVSYQSGCPRTGTLYADDLTLFYPQAGEQSIADFEVEPRGLRLHMVGEKGTTVVTGQGLGPDIKKSVPFLMARRRTSSTTFCSLLEPLGPNSAIASFESIPILSPSGEEAEAFVITSTRFIDRLFSVTLGSSGIIRTVDAASSDGLLCLIRRSSTGELLRLGLSEGSRIAEKGKDLLHATAVIKAIQIDYSAATLQIQSVEPIEGKLRVWAPGIKDVFLNQSPQLFHQEADYILLTAHNPKDRRRI